MSSYDNFTRGIRREVWIKSTKFKNCLKYKKEVFMSLKNLLQKGLIKS